MRSSKPEDWSESEAMRVVECNICGETLAAATDDELERRLRSHCEAEHPTAGYDGARARELISSEAYEASDS
jgi:hypothetical protein